MTPTFTTTFLVLQAYFVVSNGVSALLTMRGKILGWWVLLPAHTVIGIYFGLTGQFILIVGNLIMFSVGVAGIRRYKKKGVYRAPDPQPPTGGELTAA